MSKRKTHAFRYVQALEMYIAVCGMIRTFGSIDIPANKDEIDCQLCLDRYKKLERYVVYS